MRIPFKMLTLLLVCFLSCGFTHKAKNDEYSSKHHISAQNHAEKNQHSLVRRAHRAVGTPYVFGGESLAGFDCSGLVRWTYKSVGINLPRTAREQSLMGYRIMDVSKMRAGDIVAFRRRAEAITLASISVTAALSMHPAPIPASALSPAIPRFSAIISSARDASL